MVGWKTAITPIYIQNHDIQKMICVYKPESGVFEEKDRSELSDLKETWRGYYIKTDKGLIGIFATDSGPVFFVNSERYLLPEKSWDFKVETYEKNNVFTFWFDGKECVHIDYPKVTELGTHAYANEEFMDFFAWLSKKKESNKFISFYTINS